MSLVTENQPDGTPTWIDLGIPDLDRAMAFYGALFGWEFDVGPPEFGRYTTCLLRGEPVAALMPNPDAGRRPGSGGTSTSPPPTATAPPNGSRRPVAPWSTSRCDVMDQGRMAIARDPTGAQFGLWQGRKHIGARIVNEPGSLVRNDLVTPDPGPAREFYAAVFGFTLDGNPDMPEFDFTFLRRPDGHEIGGIMGAPGAARSEWNTTFEVADTDAVVAAATAGRRAGRRDPGHALRPDRHPARPVRRGVLGHHPAAEQGGSPAAT